MKTHYVKISADGRITIPANIRAALKIQGADKVAVQLARNGIMVRTVDQVIRDVQRVARRLVRPGKDVSSQSLIRERRREDRLERRAEAKRKVP